jgi:hypothetical protein
VADDFCERYGDLLTGSYDCVDRIVLNAYFPLGHNPGGFRAWWRRWHNGCDDQLDDTHLMRMAGRFARRVKAWGQANDVPVIYCKAGQRKHLIAAEHLAAALPIDQRIDHRGGGHPGNLGGDRAELDAGRFQRLAQPLDLGGAGLDRLDPLCRGPDYADARTGCLGNGGSRGEASA